MSILNIIIGHYVQLYMIMRDKKFVQMNVLTQSVCITAYK